MISIQDIAYIRCRHHDLERQGHFLEDFGLSHVEGPGPGRAYRPAQAGPPCYIDEPAAADQPAALTGVGFFVESHYCLEQALAIPGAATAIAPLPPVFGSGDFVRLTDPDGLEIDLIHGAGELPSHVLPVTPVINYAAEKLRLGHSHRPSFAPAPVLRLGHLALLSPDPEHRMAWYLEHLGMLVSDRLKSDDRLDGVFLRCDRGDAWTDHHSIAIFRTNSDARVHHCSFEVGDLDALAVANRWLSRRGWQGEWGLGRHVLGSQIFDYWRDAEGLRIEHFTDGDMFTAAKPAEDHEASLDMLYQWGPDVPASWMP